MPLRPPFPLSSFVNSIDPENDPISEQYSGCRCKVRGEMPSKVHLLQEGEEVGECSPWLAVAPPILQLSNEIDGTYDPNCDGMDPFFLREGVFNPCLDIGLSSSR